MQSGKVYLAIPDLSCQPLIAKSPCLKKNAQVNKQKNVKMRRRAGREVYGLHDGYHRYRRVHNDLVLTVLIILVVLIVMASSKIGTGELRCSALQLRICWSFILYFLRGVQCLNRLRVPNSNTL